MHEKTKEYYYGWAKEIGICLAKVSFGHHVDLSFYATNPDMQVIKDEIAEGKLFEIEFSDEYQVHINPEFIQLIEYIQLSDGAIDSLVVDDIINMDTFEAIHISTE
jgi:hypothetical protein